MATLMMMILFALVMGRVAGLCLGVDERSHWHRRRRAARRDWALPEDRPEIMPLSAPRVETPLEKLQREFARGDMSMEQYERELNRLYGIRG